MTSSTPDPRGLSSYHARLPYGEHLSPEPLLGGPFFPFGGDLSVVPPDEPVVPEPPRFGEPGGNPCRPCQSPDDHAIWRDDQWVVRGGFEPIGLPMVAVPAPIDHVTLRTMPDTLAASIRTVAAALAEDGGEAVGAGAA